MGTASYIIFLLLLGLTIFNLFAMISAKKRKSRAAYDYNRVMKPLDDKLLKAMKERKIEFTAVQRFVNDLGEGIVVVRDLKKKVFGIATAEHLIIESYSALEEVKGIYEKSGMKVPKAEVEASIGDTVYTFVIASRPFFLKGLIGSILRESYNDFIDLLQSICDEGRDQGDQSQ